MPDSPPFSRADLATAPGELLRQGRWANAEVKKLAIAGQAWTVKDFRSRSFLVRNTIGAFFVRREFRALDRLRGIRGIPAQAFRIDRHALAFLFIPGMPLSVSGPEWHTQAYFAALERLLAQVHERGIVHLDVRSSRNVLVTDTGEPAVIDFQSHLGTRWLPDGLRRWLDDFDMAGVYKHWANRNPASLGEARAALLARMNRWRRLWLPKGYLGVRKKPNAGTANPKAP